MRLLLHIVGNKLRRNINKNVAQSAAVFISVFLISAFLSFAVGLKIFINTNPSLGIAAGEALSDLTRDGLVKFLSKMIGNLATTSIAAAFLSFLTVYIYSRLRIEENKQFFATLESVGATHFQRLFISVAETLVLYAVPITVGSFIGVVPGEYCAELLAGFFVSDFSLPTLMPIAAVISFLGTVAVIAFTYSRKGRGRRSVIGRLKRHNETEVGKSHGYRNSFTFRNMPIEQRIAKKSVEYYSGAYLRIMIMFTVCALYPVLAILFFIRISALKIEAYPSLDAVDIGELVSALAGYIAFFAITAFVLLAVFAIFEVAYMIKAQNRVRMDTLSTYKSIGMTEVSVKSVRKYEYRAVALRAFICFVFSAIALFFII